MHPSYDNNSTARLRRLWKRTAGVRCDSGRRSQAALQAERGTTARTGDARALSCPKLCNRLAKGALEWLGSDVDALGRNGEYERGDFWQKVVREFRAGAI